jgi:hypothetical protein
VDLPQRLSAEKLIHPRPASAPRIRHIFPKYGAANSRGTRRRVMLRICVARGEAPQIMENYL